MAQHALRHVGTKAARQQKAHLSCPFARICRRRAKATLPDLQGAGQLGVAGTLQCRVDEVGRQGTRLQGLAQAAVAETGRLGVHQGVGGSRVAQQAALFELIEDSLYLHSPLRAKLGHVGHVDLHGAVGMAVGAAGTFGRGPPQVGARQLADELGPQFRATVFTLRQQAQRAGLDRRRFYSAAPASAPSAGMPTDSRTLFSISRARSGFSRRNSRALSLPWPIFSPL